MMTAVANKFKGGVAEAPTTAFYNSFNFDANQAVTAADSVSLQLTNNFCGAVWVNPHNRSTFQRVVSRYEVTGDQRSFALDINTSGFIEFSHSTNGTGGGVTSFITSFTVPLDELSMVHFRLGGGTLYIGINGGSEDSTSKGACFAANTLLEIGRIDGTAYSSDIDMTQVMLFNTLLSTANMATIYNGGKPLLYSLIDTAITDDAVVAYEMSSNDSTLTDLSVNSNTGTNVGTVAADGTTVEWQVTA